MTYLFHCHTMFILWGLTTLGRSWPGSWVGLSVDISFWPIVFLNSEASEGWLTGKPGRQLMCWPNCLTVCRYIQFEDYSEGSMDFHLSTDFIRTCLIAFWELWNFFLFMDSSICLTHKSPLVRWTVMACLGSAMRFQCGEFIKTCYWIGRDSRTMWRDTCLDGKWAQIFSQVRYG